MRKGDYLGSRPFLLPAVLAILCILSVSGITMAAESNSSIASQELLISPGSIAVTEGEEFNVTFTVVLIHMTCPVDPDDNTISYPSDITLVSETEWEKVTSSSYEMTATFHADNAGSGQIVISRDCPRYGLLKSWIYVDVGIKPPLATTPPPTIQPPGQTSTPPPSEPPQTVPPTDPDTMPLFDWSTMKHMTIIEVSGLYGVGPQLAIDAFNADIDGSTTLYDLHHVYGFSKDGIQSTYEWLYGIGVTSTPPPTTPPPTISPGEPTDDEDSSFFPSLDTRLVTKDYVFLLMIAASVILFSRGAYAARHFMLLAALVYFGFYLNGCMCHLGAIANFFIFDSWRLHWVVLVFVPIAASLLFGRAFCGWVCLFGAFQEFLFKARERMFPIRTKYAIPDKARYFKFVVLATIIYLAVSQSRSLFCEYDPFFYPINLMFSWDVLGMLTLMLVAASLFIERAFCRFICPLGAIFMLTDKVCLYKVRIDKKTCNSCKLCNKVCPMRRDLVSGKGECISCGDCMTKCRKDSVYYGTRRR